MRRYRLMILTALMLLSLVLMTGSCLALDESEVESAIASSSREEVSGNIFIWVLCAVGFLKVSQKIDSFMASLGINVGRTGGSMLGELMIAGRAVAAATGMSTHKGGNATNTSQGGSHHAAAGQTNVSNKIGTGVIAMTQQAAADAGAAAVTNRGSGLGSVIGTKMYSSSMVKGGQYSRDIISSVATGSIDQMGMMTGDKAADALTSYMGNETTDARVSVASNHAETTMVSNTVGGSVITQGSSRGGAQAPQSEGPTGSADVITINGGSAGGQAASVAAADGHRTIPSAPQYSNVRIGGGRITGTEMPPGGGEAKQFAMYHAGQYMEPSGPYETVRTADGESWYKQYAQPTVERTPVEETAKGVKYDEKIVMQMPPVPKRMDKI